jgi:hypothetical protein
MFSPYFARGRFEIEIHSPPDIGPVLQLYL